MALSPILLGLASLAPSVWAFSPVPSPSSGIASPVVMSSPWWENYDIKERYLCAERGGVVLERNASQAALISGGSRTTLFRELSDDPALVYRNDELRLILRGDELTLERLPMTITCLRSEQV
jgi:hypothetical protein